MLDTLIYHNLITNPQLTVSKEEPYTVGKYERIIDGSAQVSVG
jgi:hypothetical protein